MEIYSTRGVEFHGGYPKVEGALRKNDPLQMTRRDERHMAPGLQPVNPENFAGSFAEALQNAVSGVEKLDNRSHRLTQQAVRDPSSVDAHSVVIAAEKSRFALKLTKTVADGVVRAYRELSSPR